MISVVIAAYNAERFIVEAIESILTQTYADLELIVVDDGSRDRTPEIVRGYESRDGRVRLLPVEHVGQSHARNAGVVAAKYPWLAIMDADDIALPHRLQRQLEVAESDPEVVLWGAYLTRVTSEGFVIDTIKFGPTSKEAFYQIDRAKTTLDFYNGTTFCRRDLFLQVGGYSPHIQYHTDSDLCDRMADLGPIVILPESVLLYRLHENNESNRLASVQDAYYKYISARYRARQEGRELKIEDYLEAYRQRPIWERARTALRTLGLNQATNSLIAFARKQYLKGAMLALIATIAYPAQAIRKLVAIASGH